MTIDDNGNAVQGMWMARLSRNGIIVSLPPSEYKSALIGRRVRGFNCNFENHDQYRKTMNEIRQLRRAN